jgi:hypothetical protein
MVLVKKEDVVYINPRKDYTFTDYLTEFLIESAEIMILYMIYNLVLNNHKSDYLKIIKISLLVSAFSNALEWYSPLMRSQMKTGFMINIGSSILKMT